MYLNETDPTEIRYEEFLLIRTLLAESMIPVEKADTDEEKNRLKTKLERAERYRQRIFDLSW